MNIFLTIDRDFEREGELPRFSIHTSEPVQRIREFETIQEALEALAKVPHVNIKKIGRKLELGLAYTQELTPWEAELVMTYER